MLFSAGGGVNLLFNCDQVSSPSWGQMVWHSHGATAIRSKSVSHCVPDVLVSVGPQQALPPGAARDVAVSFDPFIHYPLSPAL